MQGVMLYRVNTRWLALVCSIAIAEDIATGIAMTNTVADIRNGLWHVAERSLSKNISLVRGQTTFIIVKSMKVSLPTHSSLLIKEAGLFYHGPKAKKNLRVIDKKNVSISLAKTTLLLRYSLTRRIYW
jgi:hypothetical protein